MTRSSLRSAVPIPPEESLYVSAGRGWYVVGIFTAVWTLSYLDRTITTLLTPALKADLHLTDTDVSLVQGLAFSLFFALAGLPLGRLIDRANRRNIIIAGVLGWSLMTLCCGLAANYWQLLAARVGVGVGEACLAPATLSMLADYLSPHRRGKAIGIVSSAAAFGTAGSNILGGLLLKAFGNHMSAWVPGLGEIATWRLVFIVFALPGLAAALLMLTIREPRRREKGASPGGSFAPHLLDNKATFFPIYGACALSAIVALGLNVWGPQVFIRNHGMRPADVGLIMGSIQLGAGSVAGLGGGILSDYMARRHAFDGRLRVLAILSPLAMASVALFAFSDTMSADLLGYGGIKVTYIMMSAAAYAALQDLAPNEMRGQTIAVLTLATNLVGMGLGPTMIALVTDYVLRDEAMVSWSIVIVCLPCMLLCCVMSIIALRPARDLRKAILGFAPLRPSGHGEGRS